MSANNPELKSWIDVSENSDFPIQNIPFGIFKTADLTPRAATRIGETVIDLAALDEQGYFNGLNVSSEVFQQPVLNDFMALGRELTGEVRDRIAEIFSSGDESLRDDAEAKSHILHEADKVEMLLPVDVKDYTDFYSSLEHATNVGSMFRDPENPLLPNWKHIPVGYHGRASSIIVSGVPVHRPKGQIMPKDAEAPVFGPCKLLDFELEMAFVTCTNTKLGSSITTAEAEHHIFGVLLFNDWSARDIQKWEYVPLGPFLGKNFASSVSPWIVTLDALEPFRVAGPKQEPKVLPYLQFNGDKNFDIDLEVYIQPENAGPTKVCHSNFKYMYWNMCQQLAHHTVNGCNIRVGDMYASGTISGPAPEAYGSMLELSWGGKNTIEMSDGTKRKFINDSDTVIMKGYARKDGVRIGFGAVNTQILPAL